jgi:hypothetical protein
MPLCRARRPDRVSYPVSETARGKITGSFRLKAMHGVLVLAAIGGFAAGSLVGHLAGETPMARLPEPPSMTQCVDDMSKLFGQKGGSTPEIYKEARDHCYSMIQSHHLFNDAAIRKLTFLQQYRANGVLMWTVVAVTLAGVLLAGLQLWASYQLAAANKMALRANDAQLVLKGGQLVLKSSVTGLFILLISSCLFLVFVIYVYRFEVIPDRGGSISLSPMPTLPMGKLGPPPEQEKSK